MYAMFPNCFGEIFLFKINIVMLKKKQSAYIIIFISELSPKCQISFSLICLSHENKQYALEHINETF